MPSGGKGSLNLDHFDSRTIKPELFTGQDLTMDDYFKLVLANPQVCYSAHQLLLHAITRWGFQKYTFARQEFTHWKFFDDPFGHGRDAVYGLDRQLDRLLYVIKAGALRYGQEKRIILLHGPVGSAKTTISRLLRRGLEYHTQTDEGKIFTFEWVAKDDEDREILGIDDASPNVTTYRCPIHEDPMMLLPADVREKIAAEINAAIVAPEGRIVYDEEADLCPPCRYFYRRFLEKYNGDWRRVLRDHIRVRRLIFTEVDRVGIGSFRPKDEKNQDSTELSGDINYRKLMKYGKESDPRAFNFDGEFQVCHRGILPFEEMLKLDVAFLYDLLGASQEHKIKPKRFPEMSVDVVIIGLTNNPEYEELRENKKMEALRDRITRIDIPYVLKLSDEIRVYNKTYPVMTEEERAKRGAKHIAPHTILMASLWAVITRLRSPDSKGRSGLDSVEKALLYDGKSVKRFTEDAIRELMDESPEEGMNSGGISPRYVQDKLSDAMVSEEPCVHWFLVRQRLEEGLQFHSLLKDTTRRQEIKALLGRVNEEFDRRAKDDVRTAIAADPEAVGKVFQKYLDNVIAYLNREKVKNELGELVPPDEGFMRDIEKKINVPEQQKDEFRNQIMRNVAVKARKGKTFACDDEEQLKKAITLKLFDDSKDKINLSGLNLGVVDAKEQEKIDITKQRLKTLFGYCDHCAKLTLHYVGSIFARGDKRD